VGGTAAVLVNLFIASPTRAPQIAAREQSFADVTVYEDLGRLFQAALPKRDGPSIQAFLPRTAKSNAPSGPARNDSQEARRRSKDGPPPSGYCPSPHGCTPSSSDESSGSGSGRRVTRESYCGVRRSSSYTALRQPETWPLKGAGDELGAR
jgi:hypothetical protein